jgi:DNA end-binding protein Ku
MTRAIWQGSISFGLVEIPVALYSAEKKPHQLELSMLDRHDFSPIGYKRYNKTTNREVAWGDIVRGYEHEKGEYVVLTDAELQAANPALTQTVQILHFVNADEIDPILYEKPYYLAPARKMSRGFGLLRETLKRTKKLGIARIAIHSREHIAAVGWHDDGIVLYLLRFPDEIRAYDEIETKVPAASGVQPKELAMAEKLVAEMTEKWKPQSFKDEYARDVMALIREKVASGDIHAMPAEKKSARRGAESGKILDLMPLLKKSIEGSRRRETSARTPRKLSAKKRPARAKDTRMRHSA